jgi:hypothetical protein
LRPPIPQVNTPDGGTRYTIGACPKPTSLILSFSEEQQCMYRCPSTRTAVDPAPLQETGQTIQVVTPQSEEIATLLEKEPPNTVQNILLE